MTPMSSILPLWSRHQAAQWPKGVGPHEGELMTLDTVISGCVTFYLEERRLDEPRVAMLGECLTDLVALLPDLSDEAEDYFGRLHALGQMLLATRADA